MNAHIRLVSSETVAEDVNAHENAEGRDEVAIGLPEEGGSSRNDMLGDAPPPLVAEPEDRAGGARNAGTGSKKGVARLLALILPPKPKAAAPDGEDKNADAEGEGAGKGEREEEATASATQATQEAGHDTGKAVAEADRAVVDVGGGDDRAAAGVPKAKRLVSTRSAAFAVALLASVAIAAIVVLNWPRSAPRPVVEPGMQADGQTKVMAPSAALATVPPREAPNVSRDRPQVSEAPRDALNEVLSFKGGDRAAGAQPNGGAAAATPGGNTAPSPRPDAQSAAQASAAPPSEAGRSPDSGGAAPTHPASEQATIPPVAHEATPAAPAPGAVAAAPPEPGLAEAAKIEVAKIEARLADLEMTVKDRSSEAHARLEAEKAETHTLEKIAELGALVTRLTGQVKDLQDTVQTVSTGSDEKFADLTRRVALSEANRAVAGAENAASPSPKGSADGAEAQERMPMKVAAATVKHNYRIQAASPGLAMLAAVDGGPDDRPVEVAIGTELPGYGKVVSIEQHGEAWVVKADRGSIQ